MRKHPRLDANQEEIVKMLRDIGCSVQSLASVGGGCPDLLVGFGRQNYVFECKDGSKSPSQRKLTPAQINWHENWRGKVHVIEDIHDALDAVAQWKRKL